MPGSFFYRLSDRRTDPSSTLSVAHAHTCTPTRIHALTLTHAQEPVLLAPSPASSNAVRQLSMPSDASSPLISAFTTSVTSGSVCLACWWPSTVTLGKQSRRERTGWVSSPKRDGKQREASRALPALRPVAFQNVPPGLWSRGSNVHLDESDAPRQPPPRRALP